MRRIETLIILLALGFYAWFLRRFGWADVLHYVWVAGWGLVLTVALEAFVWTVLAWMLSALCAYIVSVSFHLHLSFACGVLAAGGRPVVLMQCSGLGNALNALGSLSVVDVALTVPWLSL